MSGAAGGAALSTLALVRALRAEGFDSSIVCHPLGSVQELQNVRDAASGHVLVTPLYWWNRKIRTASWKRPLVDARDLLRSGLVLGSTRRVAGFADRAGATLIHSNTLVTLEGALASRLLGLPHVWHAREMFGPGHPFRFPIEGRPLGAMLAWGCEAVVANSAATSRILKPIATHVTLVPNGIDLRLFRDIDRPRRDVVVVGMVGNLTTRLKKHGLFVEAALHAAALAPQAEFRIYGHDPTSAGQPDEYVDALRRRAGPLGSRFRVAGFVDDPRMIMSEVDVLVHPADQESFGRVLVEAMAAGLPVIAVRGGGAAEIVVDKETGALVDVDDVGAMADAIVRYASDPELRTRAGKRGRARAESLYSLDAHVRRMIAVYERARARRGRIRRVESAA